MFQPRQHNLFRCLLDLAGEKHFIQNCIDLHYLPLVPFPIPLKRKTHLIKIKNQIQLADIPKEAIEHLYEEVDRLKICKLIVIRVDAHAKEQPRIPTVDNLVVAKLDKVALVLLVAGSNEAVNFAL
jgi:hypothetical protein